MKLLICHKIWKINHKKMLIFFPKDQMLRLMGHQLDRKCVCLQMIWVVRDEFP